MRIRKSKIYDAFRCIAGDCPDSCCQEWAVQVDAVSAEYYRSLPGELGDRLRQVLTEEDGETILSIEDGRCPMWRQDGLCRIQAELGEAALCHVCSTFPRLRHDYGDFVELGLELSCPEAARLILTDDGSRITEETDEVGEAEYDPQTMAALLSSRETALEILRAEEAPGVLLAKLLLYGYQAQDVLDGGENTEFDADSALCTGAELAKVSDFADVLQFFRGLELLTPEWEKLLCAAGQPVLTEETKALARYLVERYWLQAVSDYDLVCRVKFIVIACLLVGSLPGDDLRRAQLFSKEIENDADNVDAILDGAYDNPAFTDERLLGWLI